MNGSNSNNSLIAVVLGGFLFVSLVGSCNNDGVVNKSNGTSVGTTKSDYHDMRNRGHSEEDAVIFSILKQQGYSDYDAINATKSSNR